MLSAEEISPTSRACSAVAGGASAVGISLPLGKGSPSPPVGRRARDNVHARNKRQRTAAIAWRSGEGSFEVFIMVMYVGGSE